MRRDLRKAFEQIIQRWANYLDWDAPSTIEPDDLAEVQVARLAFITQHVARFEANSHHATVWLKAPAAAGNPYGIGQEFSGRTLAQAVDDAISFTDLNKA